MRSHFLILLIAISCTFSISCGGGGSGAPSAQTPSAPTQSLPTPSTPSTSLKITTPSILPGTVQGHAYNTTLQATGGTGNLHWSIESLSANTLFVNGLSIDPNTGVLSGTANFAGTGGFIAKVTDSSSPALTTAQAFTVTAYDALNGGSSQTLVAREYESFSSDLNSIQGGVAPLTYTLTGGSLPPGMRFDSARGTISGSAIATGTFHYSIRVQDSFSPPEVVSKAVNFTVLPPQLTLGNSLPSRIALNRPFSGTAVAAGGTPPYSFAMWLGMLPQGLQIDSLSGIISGTPSTTGSYTFGVRVTDSSSPVEKTEILYKISVSPFLGRNDTPATATRIGNGLISASISPYIDPPNGAYAPGDNDYYKLVAVPGAIVHVETFAKRNQPVADNPLDTVIEIVDPNGIRLNTCRQPGDTSTNFTSACVNDDISASPHVQDSALDLQVPAGATPPFTFLVHVLDWHGNARPDMVYNLNVSGATEPLSVTTTSLPNSSRGLAYDQQLSTGGGVAPVSWSIGSGTLPAGLSLSSSGKLSGTATVNGTYNFTVRGQDAAGQTATAPFTIIVGEPIKITSSAIFPNACVNKPYSFKAQSTGGVAPLYWGLLGGPWPFEIHLDQNTGTFSGTAGTTGTYFIRMSVSDSTDYSASQEVTLKVVQCP